MEDFYIYVFKLGNYKIYPSLIHLVIYKNPSLHLTESQYESNLLQKNEQANNGVSNINMRYPELSQQCWLSPMLCNVIFFRNHSGSCPSTMQRGPVWHQCWQLPVGFQQKHGDKWLSEHVPMAYGSEVNVRLFFSSSFVYFLNLANIKLFFSVCLYKRDKWVLFNWTRGSHEFPRLEWVVCD